MRRMSVIILLMFVLVGVPRLDLLESVTSLAVDPGPRAFVAGDAGGAIPGLSPTDLQLWRDGRDEFEQVEAVEDGLGPRFNGLSCVECHSQPARGGTSPALNPQIAAASANGATNIVPSFIKPDGPVREARFKSDGGVHSLFTIAGRVDAPGCNAQQEDFAGNLARGNVSFRIPTPVFGAGLIEAIPESTILANQANLRNLKALFGITGKVNRNGNDGRITKFGWKAQNVSLLVFAGEAYNVEMGVTNELFPIERDEDPACNFVPVPNDVTEGEEGTHSNATLFGAFMRFHAPPRPSLTTPGGADSIARGRDLFTTTGCALCHTPTLQTGDARSAALANQPVNLFSDLLCHAMGSGLADGITQGNCGPEEFRSAPLWGAGSRLFFLHDGRTGDIVQAIMAHASGVGVPFGPFNSRASEANAVIAKFRSLKVSDQQHLIHFLRSL